jgi:hypothetical protein
MWVLTPILRSGAASQRPSDSDAGGGASAAAAAAAAAAATPNVNHFIVSGPAKVGRAGGGASLDIEVHGDGSVSARHATLLLEGDGAGGSRVVLIGARCGRGGAASGRDFL